MRNFDTSGFGVGASSDPCSNTYKGPGRNSEIETRIAYKEILENAYNIRVSLSLHSIGNVFLNNVEHLQFLGSSLKLFYNKFLLKVSHG